MTIKNRTLGWKKENENLMNYIHSILPKGGGLKVVNWIITGVITENYCIHSLYTEYGK